MSGRCVCCNAVLLRTTGKRKLPDGTLVEETFCNVCRNEVNKILRDDSYTKDAKFEGIVEQQMFYGCVTPQKNPIYQIEAGVSKNLTCVDSSRYLDLSDEEPFINRKMLVVYVHRHPCI